MSSLIARRLSALSFVGVPKHIATRSIYVTVPEDADPERIATRMNSIMIEDRVFKSIKKRHEKKYQKRKRKIEEQTIRHANRRIGSMIDFILKRKKAGF